MRDYQADNHGRRNITIKGSQRGQPSPACPAIGIGGYDDLMPGGQYTGMEGFFFSGLSCGRDDHAEVVMMLAEFVCYRPRLIIRTVVHKYYFDLSRRIILC